MAARSSSSVGMLSLVTVLGIVGLGLFVTTVVFFAQYRAAEKNLAEERSTSSDIISAADRQNPVLLRYKELGKKERKSAVGYLLGQQEGLMRRVTGASTDTLDTLNKALGDSSTGSVLGLLKDRRSEIDTLKKQLADAQAARQAALADTENEVKRIKGMNDSQQKTLAALSAEVAQTKSEADRLRDDVNTFKSEMDARVDRIRQEYGGKEASLQQEIDRLQRDRALDKGLIARLQGELKGNRFTGTPEQSLADAAIIALTPADGTVTLSIGRKNKIALGLTFEIYTDAASIRPDEKTGDYPRGKASVEVVSVADDTSTARILREQRGNPVVRGDVAANAVFDPNKQYRFLVYGNFDPQHTGLSTAAGANDVKARIKSWGGDVSDELSGDVDFLVLGARPSLPPEPGASAPIEVVQEYIRLQKIAKRYDELFTQAAATSIPILNENRLYTLTGGGM